MEWLQDKFHAFVSDFYAVLKSIRIWLNTGIITVAMYLPDLMVALPQLEQYISAPDYKLWMGVLLAINFMLSMKRRGGVRKGK